VSISAELLTITILNLVAPTGEFGVPELAVNDVVMSPGASAELVVSGDISGESTFGVTILVEIMPRAGARGAVTFTPAPPIDISQVGDPWPGVATFTPLDTDLSASLALNGSVDDNGIFIPEPVTFSGSLSGFPLQASSDAQGVWDVLLATSADDSSWEGLVTTLKPGTIAVANGTTMSYCLTVLDGCTDHLASMYGNHRNHEGVQSSSAGWTTTFFLSSPSLNATIAPTAVRAAATDSTTGAQDPPRADR